MSRSLRRRLADLEKQAATVPTAPPYPPIPSLAEQKTMSLQDLQQLWDRVRRGEYSLHPEDVERLRKCRERVRVMELAGKTPAEIYAEVRREVEDEVR